MKTLLAWILALIASIGVALGAVNVNTADRAELEKLNGIGPVKAQAIIDYRGKNGPFHSLEDLDKVPGIGKATLEKVREDVTFSGPNTGVGNEKHASARESDTMPSQTARDAPHESKGRASPFDHVAANDTKTKSDAPSKSAGKSEKPGPASGELIDINSASAKELAELPGIGSARASAIVKGRPYHGKNELVDKKVIPQNVYDEIKDRIVARQKK